MVVGVSNGSEIDRCVSTGFPIHINIHLGCIGKMRNTADLSKYLPDLFIINNA